MFTVVVVHGSLVNKRQTRGAEPLAVLYTLQVEYLCERRLRSTLSFSLLADHLDADAGKGGGGWFAAHGPESSFLASELMGVLRLASPPRVSASHRAIQRPHGVAHCRDQQVLTRGRLRLIQWPFAGRRFTIPEGLVRKVARH
jgi:hypothetical protein